MRGLAANGRKTAEVNFRLPANGRERVRYTIPEEDVVEFDIQPGKSYDLSVRVRTGQP
jgi:hypothetical protein